MRNAFLCLFLLIILVNWNCTNTTQPADEPQQVITQLTSGDGDDGNVQYSPDGKYIAFTSNRSGKLAIYKQKLATGETTRISNEVNWIGSVEWSPDGQKIVYSSDEGSLPDIFVVSANGGEAQRLVSLPGQDFNPRWSPDGSNISFH